MLLRSRIVLAFAAAFLLTPAAVLNAQPLYESQVQRPDSAGAVQSPSGPTAFARPSGNQMYDLGFMGTPMPGFGIQVQSVQPNGPLTRMTSATNPAMGVHTAEPGDIIVAINNVPVQTMQALQAQLAASGGRCTMTLRNVRSGINELWSVVATPLGPAPPVPPAVVYSLQIGGQELPGQGIRVQSVTPGGAATRMTDPLNPVGPPMQMDPGDVISSINGMPTRTGAEYQAAMQSLAATGGRGQLTLLDVRTGQLRTFNFVAMAEPVANPVPDQRPPAPVLDPNSPRKIHIVLAGQSGTTVDAFNKSVDKSLTDLQSMLGFLGTDQNNQTGQPDFEGSRTVLSGANCTAQNIKQTLTALQAGPNDTIFFYYVGHGANDANGHYFQLASTGGFDLARREVAQIIQQKGVRLGVMISGSCNQSGADARLQMSTRMMMTQSLTKLEDLLLNYRGFIDINSASEGQLGWGSPSDGEFFTTVFARALSGTDPSGDWSANITQIGNDANAYFQQKRNDAINSGAAPPQMRQQTQMTPRIYALQVQPDPYNVSVGMRTVSQAYSVAIPVQGGG